MERLEKFSGKNRDLAFEFLRIFLGIGLFMMGLNFVSNPEQLEKFMSSDTFKFIPTVMRHYLVIGHLCGGFLLAIGLATRSAALIQLPILCGAVFFVHSRQGFFSSEQTLEFSLLVAVLLLAFTIYGGGRISCDFLLQKRWKIQH